MRSGGSLPPKNSEAPSPQSLIPTEDKAGDGAAFATEEYNEVARSAKLRDILLIGSEFEVIPAYFEHNHDGEIVSKLGYNSTFTDFDFDDGVATGKWIWSVTARARRKKTLSILATYLVAYDGLAGCSHRAVFIYMRRVSRFASYPYFRTHVSHLSWESGAGLPILPTISS
ncbi:hypothetical protein STHU_18350 [Allostella humosa]|nr:hypothetical protein STHU_18350 [Stella humosa]